MSFLKGGKKKEKGTLLFRVTRSTLKSSLLMGILMLCIGIVIYTSALVQEYITSSFTLARSAATVVERIADNENISRRVMRIYHSMSDEELAHQKSIDYHAKFAFIEEDQGYQRIFRILRRLRANSEVQYLYMGVYDEKTGNLVYICDPDDNLATRFGTGGWETVSEKELNRFLNWDGEGKLYDLGPTTGRTWVCTSGYPVKNEDGETVAFILADITLEGVIRGVSSLVLQYVVALAAALILIMRYMNRYLMKTVINPINSISEAAQSYIKDRNAGLTSVGHFDSLMGKDMGDELDHMTMIMSNMEHNIAAYDDALCKAVSENEKARTEMNLAARIQINMLPGEFPAFPDRDEFDIYASMDPAREVGGDFYDFFVIDQDHIGIVMADVAGKGIPAALFMMASMIILRNTALNTEGYHPADILEKSNDMICMHNQEDMFVTVWFGIMDIPSGKIIAANAGHEYPAIMYPDGRFELLKDPHGMVLGTIEGLSYKDYEISLEPGSKLFLYTDGAPEATDENNELFGTDRMLEALNKNPSADPEEVLKNVRYAIDIFVGEAPQFDDLTMLCLEYKGRSERHSKEELVRKPRRFNPKKQQKVEWH